jgi:hypothetical protein
MERLTGIKYGMLRKGMSSQTSIVDFSSKFTNGIFENTSYGDSLILNPLFYVTDPQAQSLGVYYDNGKTSLAVKKVGSSTSIFCGSIILPPDLLKNIARGAGVHLYCDSLDIIDTNDAFLMFHAAGTGQKTIILKQRSDVVDIFEQKIVAQVVSEYTFYIAQGRTRVFYLGKSSDLLNHNLLSLHNEAPVRK